MELNIYILIITSSICLMFAVFKLVDSVFLFRKKDRPTLYTVIPVDDTSNNPEYILRSILWDMKWKATDSKQIIILTYDKADDEVIDVCERICTEYNNMTICASTDLVAYIQELSIYK